jgi:aminoglycoside/choline kinase family phosphotransferase
MAERANVIESFLMRNGWGGAARSVLAGDASFRRYERLRRAGSGAVLMDAPPAHEDVRPFAAIARHLVGLGYSAPAITAEDAAGGLLLLEDLGDSTYSRALAAGVDAETLYGAAIDLLAELHRQPPPAGLAPYDEAAYLAEADLLVDWFLPQATGRATAAHARRAYHDAWSAVLGCAGLGRTVLVLRDYHADNLMWLPEREGTARVGLLDFQDALAGSPAYDVVSLLEDARRDVTEPLVEAMIARYLAAAPALAPDAFRAAYAVLGGQRNAKIVGIFTRLWRRDGKPGYLDLIPRVWRLLERDLAHPALRPVRAWFDAHVPPPLRTAPPR